MFKIKDLMVKVIPPEAERAGAGRAIDQAGWCGFCTGMDSCGGCTFCTMTCGGMYTYKVFDGMERINPPWNLSALKAQLKQRIAEVEAVEKSLEPQSLEEAEALERKLVEALEEVRRIKTTFAEK